MDCGILPELVSFVSLHGRMSSLGPVGGDREAKSLPDTDEMIVARLKIHINHNRL